MEQRIALLALVVIMIATYIAIIIILAMFRKSKSGSLKIGATKEGRNKKSEIVVRWENISSSTKAEGGN